MDVNEVAQKSLALKDNIRNLLKDFQNETGCYIENISIDHVMIIGNEKPENYIVNTKVVL